MNLPLWVTAKLRKVIVQHQYRIANANFGVHQPPIRAGRVAQFNRVEGPLQKLDIPGRTLFHGELRRNGTESLGDGVGCYRHASCYRDTIHHIIVILWASKMNVSLRPELAKFIDDEIQSGQYQSADEAVNKAVELLKQQEEAENRLEHLLQEAEDSGPATDMTAKDWTEIENEGLARLRSQKSA